MFCYVGFEGFSEPLCGIENPRSSFDFTELRSVTSKDDEGFGETGSGSLDVTERSSVKSKDDDSLQKHMHLSS